MKCLLCAFQTQSNLSLYEQYSQGPLLDGLYWTKWYNNQSLDSGDQSFIYYENMLLGVPRMRQIKIMNNSCKVHKDFSDEIFGCFDVYIDKKEDDLNFGLINGTAWDVNRFLHRITLGLQWDLRTTAICSSPSTGGPTTQRKKSKVLPTGACWPHTVERDTTMTWVAPKRRAPSYCRNWWTTCGSTEEPEQPLLTSPLTTQTSTCSVSSGKEQRWPSQCYPLVYTHALID